MSDKVKTKTDKGEYKPMTEQTSNENNYINVREFAKAVNEDFRQVYQDIKQENYCIRQFIKYDKNNRIKIDKSAIDYFLSHDKFDKVKEKESETLGKDKSDKSDKVRTR